MLLLTYHGNSINALNKSYHPQCFKCKVRSSTSFLFANCVSISLLSHSNSQVCSRDLTGQFFPSPQGDPLCEKDYYDQLGLICGGCEKPIIAGKVITMPGQNGARDVKYHVEHFQCSFCKTNLAGQKYKQRKGKVLSSSI